MYKFYSKSKARSLLRYIQPYRFNGSALFVMLFMALQLNARAMAQNITLSEKNAPLKKVFLDINKQTGLDFLATGSVLELSKPVNIQVKEQPIKNVLDLIFQQQPLQYELQEKIVVVSKKEPVNITPKTAVGISLLITGKVTDTAGRPLQGASIRIKSSFIVSTTNVNGDFTIENGPEKGVFLISYVGYQSVEVPFDPANKKSPIIIRLQPETSTLNDIQIIGYGTTTKRFNTGSVASVSADDIAKQPVTNVLSAMSGRMPGVFVQTTNGLPGGNINIQIRGKGSILAGTDPLYVIDGVPFASALVPNNVITTGSIIGANSPLNSLNPADIESISILKDADATAIYGSRGTNGVVLITTKKGKAGKTKTEVSVNKGITKIADYPRLLNLDQYLQIRQEAFTNNGLTPSNIATSANYAPDLTIWDRNNSTDWTRYLFGGTGRSTDAQVGLSGGSITTHFNISANYHEESTVLPGDNLYQRGGIHLTLQHKSLDNKFSLLLNTSYVADNNNTANPVGGISADILLPPNYPVYDASGNYNWYIDNPYAAVQATSITKTNNLIGNIGLSYSILQGLDLKLNGGFNRIENNQTEIFPTVSLNPNGYTNPYFGSSNYTDFGTSTNQSVIIEPQLDYHKSFESSTLAVLIGGTYQNTLFQNQSLVASNFTSQSLMQNLGSAAILSNQSSTNTQYKYESVFGRVTYNLLQKYIINGTVRRDGSSRFGPGNQFGTFGSVGAAWLFSTELWVKNNLPLLSFGKLRSSYGLTGNDQISDYQYLSTYSSLSTYNYQGISSLRPSRIANGDFHWETTHKLEFAIELGLLNDRVMVNIDYYQNQSHDQLVNYTLPRETGFSSYQANLPAVVQNSGWEFELTTKNVKTPSFSWTTNFNITLPKNILKSFENFSTSSYSQTLQIGYDITRIYGYQLLGINPANGLASYAPQPGSTSTSPYQYNTLGKQTPDFFGGFGNTFAYKNWQLDVFGQFAKQVAKGGLVTTPGAANNSYVAILNRWQQAGDQTNVPKASTISDSFYANSSANIFDASYFRVKNIALSYSFPQELTRKLKVEQLRIFVHGENIFTWWNKNSALLDPESGALTNASKNIPPMKTIVAGVQISF